MNIRKQKHHPLTVNSSACPTRSRKDKENVGELKGTERKSSLEERVGLAELTNNRFEMVSGTKGQSYRVSRQASIQISKKAGKCQPSKLVGSGWLDNDKQMMQFILNLKSKKSSAGASRSRKESEGFQFDSCREEQRDLLCNRMLQMKKIQKYQKQAISSFYQKDYNRCFGQLSKAQALMRRQRIDSAQHQLYINYLYSEFCFKLQKFQQWKMYQAKAKSFVNRIENSEMASMKEYILNLKALDVCLALHEEEFQRVLQLVGEIAAQDHLSSKIRRRISNAEIEALKKLGRFKEALTAIEEECQALQSDPDVHDQKKDVELGRLLQSKVVLTADYISTESALILVEKLIGFQEVSMGTNERFSYYNIRVFDCYASLLRKKLGEQTKLLFFYQKWAEVEESKKEKLRIELQLFRMYYEMGIYERALQLFDSISSQNVVYLGPEYLFMFASIKHFNGEEKEAIGIVMKCIDMCQDEEAKALFMYRLLELDLEEEGPEFRFQRECAFQTFLRGAESGSVSQICELYLSYLQQRGQFQRAVSFSSQLRRTAVFAVGCSLQSKLSKGSTSRF